ncbi:hypothetical protein G6F24_018239 [Rhizopus arrhizus]|nr:hypothetical protein G6F24_018239 [Rhizopus arrhizus]
MPIPLLQPFTLEGDVVRLEPLALAPADALADVGLHPELWRLQPEPIASADDMRPKLRADHRHHALYGPRAGAQKAGNRGNVAHAGRPAFWRQYRSQIPVVAARF